MLFVWGQPLFRENTNAFAQHRELMLLCSTNNPSGSKRPGDLGAASGPASKRARVDITYDQLIQKLAQEQLIELVMASLAALPETMPVSLLAFKYLFLSTCLGPGERRRLAHSGLGIPHPDGALGARRGQCPGGRSEKRGGTGARRTPPCLLQALQL